MNQAVEIISYSAQQFKDTSFITVNTDNITL